MGEDTRQEKNGGDSDDSKEPHGKKLITTIFGPISVLVKGSTSGATVGAGEKFDLDILTTGPTSHTSPGQLDVWTDADVFDMVMNGRANALVIRCGDSLIRLGVTIRSDPAVTSFTVNVAVTGNTTTPPKTNQVTIA